MGGPKKKVPIDFMLKWVALKKKVPIDFIDCVYDLLRYSS